MQNEIKYKLSQPSEEEQKNFMKVFNDLCNDQSMYFEPVPQFTRESLTDPWKITCQIFLQKKTPFSEPEIVVEKLAEGAVVSPMQADDLK